MTHHYEEAMRRKRRERVGMAIYAGIIFSTILLVAVATIMLIMEGQ